MNRPTNILTSALLALALFSCQSVETPVPPVTEEGGQYIRLRLSMPAASRAESHPDEDALENEYRVDNLTLFIYQDENGLNGSAETTFAETHYLTAGQFTQKGNSIEVLFRNREHNLSFNDRIAALINMGDQSGLSTLGNLQELITPESWKSADKLSGYYGFAMANANANDGQLKVYEPGNAGTEANPFTAHLEVERVAARIDLGYNSENLNSDKSELVYTAVDKTDRGIKVGTVYVTHALPVNVQQSTSYALKRITKELNFNEWLYTGTLPKDNNRRPTAYVLEPYSKQELDTRWYGATAAAGFNNNYYTAANSLTTLLGDAAINVVPNDHSSDLAVILSYANENNRDYTEFGRNWPTGVALSAIYVPAAVFTDGEATVADDTFARGRDFWRYLPTRSASLEKDVLYFTTREAAETYAAKHPQQAAEITLFPGGRCYYNLWLKHTVETPVPDPDKTFAMEYGIVRNHIYRFTLSFTGAGYPDAVIREPENVEIAITVRPWRTFEHPEIIM